MEDIYMAKKLRSLIRVICFMFKNNISKKKLMVDLNISIKKRGKIATKAFQNLIFHHTNHNASINTQQDLKFTTRPGDYEFTCDTPARFNIITFPFHITNLKKRNNHDNHHSRFFSCAHAPQTDENDDVMDDVMAAKELENLNNEAASPALPGFGRTPMVRQLRVTDSPFPYIEGDIHVDAAAEDFINKFYKELRNQNTMSTPRN